MMSGKKRESIQKVFDEFSPAAHNTCIPGSRTSRCYWQTETDPTARLFFATMSYQSYSQSIRIPMSSKAFASVASTGSLSSV